MKQGRHQPLHAVGAAPPLLDQRGGSIRPPTIAPTTGGDDSR